MLLIQQQPQKAVKRSIHPLLPPQGHCSPAFSQPPGVGNPQRLSHVRQYGLDRPVAPRGRRSHGGSARGSAGLWTRTIPTRSRLSERTGHLEQTHKQTAAAQHANMSVLSLSCLFFVLFFYFCTQSVLNRQMFCQAGLKRHTSPTHHPI